VAGHTRPQRSPWRLGIETSNPSADETGPGVAAQVAGGAITTEPLRAVARHDDDLMPAIERLRDRLGLRPADLQLVAVSIGPGGYTALRVAVATAATIAEVAGAAVAPVPSARVAARDLAPEVFPAVVCLASKRGSAHATRFETREAPGESLGLITADDLVKLDVRTLVGDRFLPETMVENAGALRMAVIPPRFHAANMLELADCVEAIPPDQVRPWYPREPEAVRRWLERPQA